MLLNPASGPAALPDPQYPHTAPRSAWRFGASLCLRSAEERREKLERRLDRPRVLLVEDVARVLAEVGIDPARSLIQGSCRPLRDASVAARANSAVTSLVRSFNVSVLRAFSTSANRWDEHIDRHSEYARTKNSTDCTHFCEPSSLMATLNGELLAAVRRSDRSKS